MTRFLNAILILILLVVFGRLVMQGQEYWTLSKERGQLFEKLDGFRVRDPNKHLVQLVDNDDPMLFTWRVYTPGAFRTIRRSEWGPRSRKLPGGTVVGVVGQGSYETVSIRFELSGDKLVIHDLSNGTGGIARHTSQQLVDFIGKHAGDLEFEMFGSEGPVEVSVDKTIELLSIRIPAELHAELELTMGEVEASQFISRPFYRMWIGEKTLMEQMEPAKDRYQL